MTLDSFNAIDFVGRFDVPELQDLNRDDDILEWVAAYINSDYFEIIVNQFCNIHSSKFRILISTGGPSTEELNEMKTVWQSVHEEFVALAQNSIATFLQKHEFTMEQYEARCERELQFTNRRQRHTRFSFYIQTLQSCCEYEQFLNLMARAADTEYHAKRALKLKVEDLVLNQTHKYMSMGTSTCKNKNTAKHSTLCVPEAAQDFLEYFHEHPYASLHELQTEFHKRLQSV